ncbi:MAG TPA: pyrimidine-nucleoside phosphorylase [Clostridiales bacterium]|nr:pyrimidine-nucleoside phosphorylase [Clostridiales bacterium]
MRAVDIIIKKRRGEALSKEEINFFIDGFVNGSIPDYQASAFLMAVCCNGMDSWETVDLTLAMVNSGEKVDLSRIKGIKADKHSTGGVGDTTTLIVAPLVAACGVLVAKMSGRGLGHTGGTLDKLESIPGFRTNLTMEEFINSVQTAGLAVIGQSKDLVPADKLLYALRDVTGTVDSIPLIASSIMSKKIAAGSDAIVLDVKSGSGAFLQSLDDSFALADAMVKIGVRAGKRIMAVITDMDQPLGMAIGNALEVKEAIEVLKNKQSGPLKEVSLYLAANMLLMAKACTTLEKGLAIAGKALESGKGLAKLGDMIRSQGGLEEVLDNTDLLPKAKHIIPVKTDKDGYVSSIDTREIGICSLLTGAGRSRKEDEIDPAAGLVMQKRVGDKVQKGDTLAVLHTNKSDIIDEVSNLLRNAFHIKPEKPKLRPLVLGTVTKDRIQKFV